MAKLNKDQWVRVRVDKELKERFARVVAWKGESEGSVAREAMREYIARWEAKEKVLPNIGTPFPGSSAKPKEGETEIIRKKTRHNKRWKSKGLKRAGENDDQANP
jgi:antitoxin component of RelBE/YafQ-DinJ toxin-antitoxin module